MRGSILTQSLLPLFSKQVILKQKQLLAAFLSTHWKRYGVEDTMIADLEE